MGKKLTAAQIDQYHRATADSEHVRRLKRAGLVIFGQFLASRPLPHLRAGSVRRDEEPLGHDAHLRGSEWRCGGLPSARACSPWRTLPTGSAHLTAPQSGRLAPPLPWSLGRSYTEADIPCDGERDRQRSG